MTPRGDVFHRVTCRLCGGARLSLAVPLEPSAIADAYLPPADSSRSLTRYPLDLYLCEDCGHVQLLDVVNPRLLFDSYTYRTASSFNLVEHFRRYADEILALTRPHRAALVVDIGSNDGTLLRHFQTSGLRVLGVDPAAAIAAEATAAGVETWPRFFSADVAAEIVATHGHASIITANNVFAHADDLPGIADGVRTLLRHDGVFAFEVSYLVDLVERLLFDTVYHEHLSYHSLAPLDSFLARQGLQLIDVQRLPTKGGSIRCLAQLTGGPRSRQPSLAALLALEQDRQMNRLATFTRFAAAIRLAKETLHGELNKLRTMNARLAGFGASATVTTLLHQFQLAEYLPFLVDDNSSKWGLLSPGHHLPVLSPARLQDDRIDYAVVLAWNYTEQIVKSHRAFCERGGRFLIPLPRLEVRS